MQNRTTYEGTGQLQLFGVSLSMLCSICIHHFFATRFKYQFVGGAIVLFILEFSALILPPLLVHTYLGKDVVTATAYLLIVSFILCILPLKVKALKASIFRDFKIIILVSTCVVIAAVDCRRIFTSQFGKTTHYGFSPMDLGTGLFVAVRAFDSLRRDLRRSNAFTASTIMNNQKYTKLEAVLPEPSTSSTKDVQKGNPVEWSRFVVFFLVGLIRIIFIELSGYGHDPKEYGQHWNFFITLAFIELFVLVFHWLFQTDLAVPIVSVLIGLFYFAILLCTDFEEYLLGVESFRQGFLNNNREGICSFFGYMFIFGLTYLTAYYFIPFSLWDDSHIQEEGHGRLFYALTRNLVVQSIVYAISLYLFGLPSRRVANLVYGLHIHTIVTLITLFMYTYMHYFGKRAEDATFTSQLSTLHTAISRHGAYFFITGNLLTGFLNYCREYIQTPGHEFLSLIAYMFVLCLSTQLLDLLPCTYMFGFIPICKLPAKNWKNLLIFAILLVALLFFLVIVFGRY